jgi:hypothetical protein
MVTTLSQEVEWVLIATGRRIAYGIGAVVLFLIFATVACLDLLAGRTGVVDMAIMGGTLAGGAFAAFAAITGKEQRKVKRTQYDRNPLEANVPLHLTALPLGRPPLPGARLKSRPAVSTACTPTS